MADLTVPLTFRTAGAWGPGQNRNLSAEQVDSNFYELALALANALANPPSPIEIASFNVAGAALTIVMSNGSTVGPLPLPVLMWRWRDAWMPFVPYAQLDVFKVEGTGIFLVLLSHNAAASFDPLATDVGGNPLYMKLIGTAIPPGGGTTGQILRKASDADNDTRWEDAPLPVAFFMPGAPDSNALSQVVMTEAGLFPANFAGSFGPARVAATAAATVIVNVAGSAVGSVTYDAASATPVFMTAGGGVATFTAGDVVELGFPAVPDLTLADIAITLRAIRS
jgi:hypothetical protein